MTHHHPPAFDVHAARAQFPALRSGAVFFDNPGGTQVAQPVIDRMNDMLIHRNANHGGAFRTSRLSDEILDEAHAAMADLLNCDPAEVVFGANMTTLTLHMARSLAHRLEPGDEVIVTRLDHDANVAPWLLMARDRGAVVRWVDVDVEDGTLRLDDFQRHLNPRTKLVAVGYASNALGTVNDVATITRWAHAVGAWVYVDAVQYAPHGLIDVRALDCDFLACSAYKFFGPHVGVLFGKRAWLQDLPAYKVRPATNDLPGKWETGTQNHEGIGGVLGAVDYLASLGQGATRRAQLASAWAALLAYEQELGAYLLAQLQTIPGLHIYGLIDPARLAERVPTVSFTLAGQSPRQVAEHLAQHDIYVWDGNYYALEVAERLGVQASGGMVRVGLAHYNTHAEVDRLMAALHTLAK